MLLLLFLAFQGCSKRARLQQITAEWQHWQMELQPQFPGWPEYLALAPLHEYEVFLEEAIQRLQSLATTDPPTALKPAIESLRKQLVSAQVQTHALHQDPSLYNLPARWEPVLKDKNATYENLLLQLKEAPAYYASVRQLLTTPDPLFCQKAIEEHIAGLSVLNQLSLHIEQSSLNAASKTSLQLALSQTKIAIKDYIAWCNSQAIESFESN